MLNMFKKTFYIRDKFTEYPQISQVKECISEYCADADLSCEFVSDTEVLINGERFEFKRELLRGFYDIRVTKIY